MAKRKQGQNLGIMDIVGFAKSGWTPTEVNNLLDRLDSMGDINSPEEVEDEDDDIETKDQDESDEDENDNASVEDDSFDEDEDDNKEDSSQNESKIDLLKSENNRLKNQLQKLQKKNRHKDVSGGGDNTPIEKSLIDTFQSLFD